MLLSSIALESTASIQRLLKSASDKPEVFNLEIHKIIEKARNKEIF